MDSNEHLRIFISYSHADLHYLESFRSISFRSEEMGLLKTGLTKNLLQEIDLMKKSGII
jgi:hypothetical protein